MDTLQWRGRARIVAYLDLVLTSLVVLGVLLITIFAGYLTSHLNKLNLGNSRVYFKVKVMDDGWSWNSRHSGDSPDAKNIMALTTTVVLWIFVAVFIILAFIQLYAAIKLLQGTDLAREYSDAWRNCATWRNITVVFLVFQIVGGLSSDRSKSLIISVLIHGTFLYIVHKFMAELDQRRSPLEVPNMVTIMRN